MAAFIVILVLAAAASCSCRPVGRAAATVGADATVQTLVHSEAPLVRTEVATPALSLMEEGNTLTLAHAPEEKGAPDGSGCGDTKIACSRAQAQSPRDVTPGAEGSRPPKFPVFGPPGVGAATEHAFVQVNTHFHLGAEHRSAGEWGYDVEHGGAGDVCEHNEFCEHHNITKQEVGYFCRDRGLAGKKLLAPYDFKHCHGVKVGNTYEIHWVFSTGGDKMLDGLQVTQTSNNPHAAVRGQVYVIVNPEPGASMSPSSTNDDLMHTWRSPKFSVQYAGSTTGTKHTNECCSRTEVSWHVDQECHEISAASFDNMCRVMAETYKMTKDTSAHGAREIVSPNWVVPAKYVQQIPSAPTASN